MGKTKAAPIEEKLKRIVFSLSAACHRSLNRNSFIIEIKVSREEKEEINKQKNKNELTLIDRTCDMK